MNAKLKDVVNFGCNNQKVVNNKRKYSGKTKI